MELVAKKYMQTEVGLIPNDWEVKALGEIAFIKRGKFTPRPRNNPIYYGGNIPFVQTGDVTKSRGKVINYSQTLNEKGLAVSTLFKKGTVLMTIAANIGYTGVLQIDMACPDSLVAIDGLENSDNEFLNFYFSFKREKLEELATTGAQMNLNIERLSPFKIPLPKLIEQTAIANALSDADDLITSLEKLIAKKRNIKQGAMQKLLQPKEGWVVKRLGDSSKIFRGGSPRPIESFLTSNPDGINWIKIGDVKKNTKYIEETEEKISKDGMLRSRFVNSGDFILSNSMSFGRPYILKISGCIHDGWLVIQDFDSEFDRDFLFYILGSEFVLLQYKSMAAGSSVLNLNKEIVKNVIINCPSSLTEQKEIALILSDLDNEIGALETKLEKYQKVKLGMMQNLLTGRIRLV